MPYVFYKTSSYMCFYIYHPNSVFQMKFGPIFYFNNGCKIIQVKHLVIINIFCLIRGDQSSKDWFIHCDELILCWMYLFQTLDISLPNATISRAIRI